MKKLITAVLEILIALQIVNIILTLKKTQKNLELFFYSANDDHMFDYVLCMYSKVFSTKLRYFSLPIQIT